MVGPRKASRSASGEHRKAWAGYLFHFATLSATAMKLELVRLADLAKSALDREIGVISAMLTIQSANSS